jgi:hypothetical protein
MKINITQILLFLLLFTGCGFKPYQLYFNTFFEIKDQKGKIIPNHKILSSISYWIPTSPLEMGSSIKSDASGKADWSYKLWVDDSNIQAGYFMADTTQNLMPTNLLEISGYQPQPTVTQTLEVDTSVYYTVHIVRKSTAPQSLLLLARSELMHNKYYTFLSDAEEKIGAFDRTFKFKAYKSKPFKFDCSIYTTSYCNYFRIF